MSNTLRSFRPMTHASPSHALCRGSLVRRPAHHVSPDPPFVFPSQLSSLFSSLSLSFHLYLSLFSLSLPASRHLSRSCKPSCAPLPHLGLSIPSFDRALLHVPKNTRPCVPARSRPRSRGHQCFQACTSYRSRCSMPRHRLVTAIAVPNP